jgi:hypothetical protein
MLPDVNHPVWKHILTGDKTVNTGKAAIGLLIQSCRMSYGTDQSPDNLNRIAARMHGFFTRYESAFSTEIAEIFE